MPLFPPRRPNLPRPIAEQLDAWGEDSIRTEMAKLADASRAYLRRDGKCVRRTDIEAWLKWRAARKEYWSLAPKWAAAFFSLIAASAGVWRVLH